MLEFKDEVIKRLDKIDEKLDRHMEQSNTNKADIAWVKGFIKVSTAVVVAVFGSIASFLLHAFSGK